MSLLGPIIHPPRGDLPVVLSVPHSGRDYPDWLITMAFGGHTSLATLEDPLVDRLVWRAVQRGCGAVIARAPRAAVDCNRSEDEIDPSVVDGTSVRPLSVRARGGLGIARFHEPVAGVRDEIERDRPDDARAKHQTESRVLPDP